MNHAGLHWALADYLVQYNKSWRKVDEAERGVGI